MITNSKIVMRRKRNFLTNQEINTLKLAAAGLDNPHIGKKLYVSSHTVKAHMAAIYKKLNAANRTQAVYIAMKKHIID